MRTNIIKKLAISAICVVSLFLASHATASAPPPIPNPVLVFNGQSFYQVGSVHYVRYSYFVFNSEAFPDTMFAAAPTLPPCGKNTNSSRSWVDLFDQRGKRLNGFCALGKSDDMNGIWFALEEGVVPPSYIYIEITDRQTNTKYKSNLADTTM
jgi:opacity protein-like surface antigen